MAREIAPAAVGVRAPLAMRFLVWGVLWVAVAAPAPKERPEQGGDDEESEEWGWDVLLSTWYGLVMLTSAPCATWHAAVRGEGLAGPITVYVSVCVSVCGRERGRKVETVCNRGK